MKGRHTFLSKDLEQQGMEGKQIELGRVCGCNHREVPHSWYRVNERETPGPGAEGGA